MSIEIEGMEEFEELLQNMVLDASDKKKAVRAGIKVIAKSIENKSPKGKTKRLSKIKTTVKDTGLSVEGIAHSKAFYDVFEEFGTSQQKKNIGYFDRAAQESSDEAINEVAKVIFAKVR
ncbi:HK97-gp10 family putative phage morphogenesis protein [Eubacterium multiforme]|uniref:HK97 gp10 family phage protein n=1 Tax=Eubacterium multiforme TaxID=83339 RepID=A0ABT9USD4_9FIRM|nr:HK97-gp10 family putative phage morphogenesis protein [Eubacterium multiforme]MDQ0149216.1 HK97 gp10 family phage protein [Eubacterium multiforme]